MTSPAALALIFAVLTAFLVGYRAPGAPAEPLGLSRFPRPAASSLLVRPNEVTLAALDDFQVDLVAAGATGPDPNPVEAQGDPVPPPETPAVSPPPPPPDIALVFRRRLAAVVDQGPAGLAALVLDPSQEARATRLVRPGDVFEGPWRLETLTSSEAVLRDGRRTRRVAFYGVAGSAAEL